MNSNASQLGHEFLQKQQSDTSNKVFTIANCFQNVEQGTEGWFLVQCVTMTIEWANYLILSCLLAFLLTLHCLMYTKINKRCSVRVLKRNRV